MLHHFATLLDRRRCAEAGPDAKVEVKAFPEEDVWYRGRWGKRSRVLGLEDVERDDSTQSYVLDVVGFADDTTLVGRLSTSDLRRECATRRYAEWGHRVHPEKWQKLWSGKGDKPDEGDGGFVDHAKVLGCFLASDGGYEREFGNRISKAGAIFSKLVESCCC